MSGDYALRVGEAAVDRLGVLDEIHHRSSDVFLERVLGRRPAMILDLGCGTGLTTTRLRRLADEQARVVGIDRSPQQIAAATAAFGRSGIEFRVADIVDPAVDLASYDIVYGRFVLTHNSHPGKLLMHLFERLRPGACLALEEPDIGSAFSLGGNGSMERAEALYVSLGTALDQEFGTGSLLVRSAMKLAADAEMGFIQPILTTAARKSLYRLGLDEVRPQYLAKGLSTAAELDVLRQRLTADIDDPHVCFASARIAQIVLRKS